MPELPEVETTLRGIEPALRGRTIAELIVRNFALRWPITAEVDQARGQKINRCWRRAKYLLIGLADDGTENVGACCFIWACQVR